MSEAVADIAGSPFSKSRRTNSDAEHAMRHSHAALPSRVKQPSSQPDMKPSFMSPEKTANARHSPEQLYSTLRGSVMGADPSTEGASTLVMAFLSQFYPISVASSHALRLIEHFGTIASLLKRSAEELVRVVPLSDDAIFMLKVVHRIIASALREPVENRPIIGDHAALNEYLKFTMIDDGIEATNVLYLNGKNMLIKDERHSTGTVDHCPVYPREIVKRALELSAVALIVVHNHPTGDPTPSDLDIAMTRQLWQVLDHMGVKLHDSIIIGKNGSVSFRGSRLL